MTKIVKPLYKYLYDSSVEGVLEDCLGNLDSEIEAFSEKVVHGGEIYYYIHSECHTNGIKRGITVSENYLNFDSSDVRRVYYDYLNEYVLNIYGIMLSTYEEYGLYGLVPTLIEFDDESCLTNFLLRFSE